MQTMMTENVDGNCCENSYENCNGNQRDTYNENHDET